MSEIAPHAKYSRQIVTEVKTWVADKLFSLRTTRDPAFVFQAGQFARLGLPPGESPAEEPTIWRAYSMVSSPDDDALEFYSIVVPGGEFSIRLANLQVGDPIYVDRTAFGFLTLERFEAGGDLWLLGSGTGLSAYMSLLRSTSLWERYERIVLVHGVRQADELAYRPEIEALAQQKPGRLIYLPLPTRDDTPGMPRARITALLQDGRLETLAGVALDPASSKIMLCGNPALLADARKLLAERGFAPGRRGVPGNLAVENYW